MTPEARVPGIAVPTIAGPPLPARTDDGNDWFDGRCWLWCGQEATRVIWLGPAQTAGGVAAPFTACGRCVQLLHDAIWEYVTATDHGVPKAGTGALGVPAYEPPAADERATSGRRRSGRPRGPGGLLRRP